ncbi:shikimate kinase [Risungbinella massiliensis]|uniref:shikimate kinase n=1 Tax=Risungbinella massiliensis TaxID=1329796 RepID=UPI0005CC6391|nr:shikimate kinase [Risungbinella massiliensis]
MQKQPHLYLVGMSGVGKSTVGNILTTRYQYPSIDTDQYLEDMEEKTIAEIFQYDGEFVFRRLESETLLELSQRRIPHLIITGGGMILDSQNRQIMQETGKVIYLQASSPILRQRLLNEMEWQKRPLLQENWENKLETMLVRRDPLYREVADLVVRTDHLTSEEVVEEILRNISRV